MPTINKKDEEKLMELHYARGIDFPVLHEPIWPLPRAKKAEKIAHKKTPVPAIRRVKQYIRR